MNYGEFMAFHRTHEPSRLYLLAGEENYFIKKAEKHLLSLLFPDGCQPEDIQLLGAGASIPEIIGSIQSVPFFTDRNVIIVRDTDLFRERRGAADDEKKTDMIEQLNRINTIIYHFCIDDDKVYIENPRAYKGHKNYCTFEMPYSDFIDREDLKAKALASVGATSQGAFINPPDQDGQDLFQYFA